MGDGSNINYLEELLRKLTEQKVRFVVAGGVAAVLHGVERTTMDLDIALEMSQKTSSVSRRRYPFSDYSRLCRFR